MDAKELAMFEGLIDAVKSCASSLALINKQLEKSRMDGNSNAEQLIVTVKKLNDIPQDLTEAPL